MGELAAGMIMQMLARVDGRGSCATSGAGQKVVGEGAKQLALESARVGRRHLVLGGINGNVFPAVLCARALAHAAAGLVAALGADRVDRTRARLGVGRGRAARHVDVERGMRKLRRMGRGRDGRVDRRKVAKQRVLMENHGSVVGAMEWA